MLKNDKSSALERFAKFSHRKN